MNHTFSSRISAPIQTISLTLLSLTLLTSCSTITKSIALGAGIGLATGALIGSAVGQNEDHDGQNRATFTGAAAGIALGSLIGYEAFNQQVKKTEQLSPQLKGFEKDPKIPSVTMPVVRKMWVPDRIDGNKFEAGHYIYILEKTSTWSNYNDK